MVGKRLTRYPTVAVIASFVGVVSGLFNEPPVLRDLIRAVELIAAALIVTISLLIARRYWGIYRADPTGARLLPRHVARLGFLVVGLTFIVSCAIVDQIGEPFSWYLSPVALPTLIVGALGLVDMVRWLPEREREAHANTDEERR